MITATTRLVALLGHPVDHSLSPRMQDAAFAARALDWAYVACDVESDALPEAVAGLRALRFVGGNVTIPHKGAVAELCDDLDELSRRSCAVNTLVFRDGRIVGANTDGPAVASVLDVAGDVGPVERARREGRILHPRGERVGDRMAEERDAGSAHAQTIRATAARIASSGAATPVQSSKAAAPWRTRISRPSTTVSHPASRAPATSAVGRPSAR